MRLMPGSQDDDLALAHELAYEEAGRALDGQERTVNELRSRAGVLIAAAAISTSFFSSRAITGSDVGTWAWLAIAAFVVVGGSVLFVLWPRHEWSFSASASDLIGTYIEPQLTPISLIHRDLALHRSAAYDANARQLRTLFRVFRVGLVVLVIETALWVVAIADRA